MSEFTDFLEDEDQVREKLDQLRAEHQELDDLIDGMAHTVPVDFLQIQRLKKRKLAVRDTILRLESLLLPDIIA